VERWQSAAVACGVVFCAFSAAHLIDEFLWRAPMESHLLEPTTELLALGHMLAVVGLLALAARGRRCSRFAQQEFSARNQPHRRIRFDEFECRTHEYVWLRGHTIARDSTASTLHVGLAQAEIDLRRRRVTTAGAMLLPVPLRRPDPGRSRCLMDPRERFSSWREAARAVGGPRHARE